MHATAGRDAEAGVAPRVTFRAFAARVPRASRATRRDAPM
jgi:hypothetical protein